MSEDITVYLEGGTHRREKTFTLTELDSGKNGYQIIYRSYPNQTALISGGSELSGWTKHEGEIYKLQLSDTDVNTDNNFRELYIDGKRAYRAREPRLFRAMSWHHDENKKINGYVVSKNHISKFNNDSEVEFIWSMNWRQHRLLVDKIEAREDGNFNVIMKQPFMTQALREDFPSARANFNRPFFVENAYELLNEPGEWYYDRSSKTLYYWPKKDQDMNQVKAVIPRLETLVSLKGSSKAKKVENVSFTELAFKHTVWQKAYKEGATSIQANHYNVQPAIVDSENNGTGSHTDNAELPRGAVELEYTKNIDFISNKLAHTGATGIILLNGCIDTEIRKNHITDISETSIIIGSWVHNFIDQDHEELCEDILIRNNIINGTGLQYWGAPAIQMYYSDSMTIEHNEILHSNYGGIQFGWNGWQGTEKDSTSSRNTIIRYNKIAEFTKKTGDSGSIYSLGQQPNTEIYENYFRNAHKYQGAQYNDEGSAYVYWHENVVDQKKAVKGYHLYSAWRATIHDNWCDMTYTNYTPIQNKGTRCYVTNVQEQKNGWNPRAQSIIDNAGLTLKPYIPARNPAKNDVAYGKNAIMYKAANVEDYGAIGHLAQFAVDGNPDTSALPKDVKDFTLEVDLIKIYSINKINLSFAKGHESGQVTLFASRDGIDWTQVGTNKSISFDDMDARFVKVEAKAGDKALAISNIEVFGQISKKRKNSAPVKFTPPQASSLKLWVKADEGVETAGEDFVAQWKDFSGNNNHLVLPKAFTKLDPISSGTTVSTKKPVLWNDMKNGRPAVRFDGFDDCLESTGVTGDFKNNTIVILFRPHTVNNYNQVFQAKGGWGEFMLHAGNGGTVYAGSTVNSRFVTGKNIMKPAQWQTITYTAKNGTAKLFNNKQLVSTQAVVNPKAWTGFMFGMNLDFREKNNGFTLDADIAEVFIYNNALSETELATVKDYLNKKYQLAE